MSLVESIAQVAAERRRVAAERYRELLLRNDSPQAGDSDALLEVMQTLGRTPDDLPGDVELVQRIAALEAIEAEAAEREAAWHEGHKAHSAELKKAEEARAALEEKLQASIAKAHAVVSKALAAHQTALQAKGDLRDLRDRWAALAENTSVETIRDERRHAAFAAPSIHGPGQRPGRIQPTEP